MSKRKTVLERNAEVVEELKSKGIEWCMRSRLPYPRNAARTPGVLAVDGARVIFTSEGLGG